jgi:hypothetical protein
VAQRQKIENLNQLQAAFPELTRQLAQRESKRIAFDHIRMGIEADRRLMCSLVLVHYGAAAAERIESLARLLDPPGLDVRCFFSKN